MKQHITILYLLIFFSFSAIGQTIIPLPGFQAVLKEFPTISGDTITAKFSITDFSNQWRGQDLNGRDHLVLWRNCKRYPIIEVVQAFSTEVIVKLDKNGNPNLLPGVCALLQETPGQMVSHLISGITDSDKQCIDSYYRVDALVTDTTECCWDSLYISKDSIVLFNGSGKIAISDILKQDSIYVNSLGDTVFMKYAKGFVKLPQYDLSVINKDFFWYSNGSTGVLWNKAVPDIDTITTVKVLATDGEGGYDWYYLSTLSPIPPEDSTVVISGTAINVVEFPDHTFTINNTAPDQIVTIGQSGIVSVTGTYPNFTIGATEVDGSITNEIQTIDTFSIVSNQLRLSLTQDNQIYKSVDLSPYINTDAQTLSRSGFDLSISGGNTVTFPGANGSTTGWLTSTDWTSFNNKPSGTGAANKVAYWNGTNSLTSTTNFHFDAANLRLGIGTSSPAYRLDVAGTDIQVNGARIGLGGGGVATNIAFGANALQNNSTGTLNVAIGQGALQNYTGNLNLAIGWAAMNGRTTGGNNMAIGPQSMRYANTGTDNTAIGALTLRDVTGSENTAVGSAAGYPMTSGIRNTIVGAYAGGALTTGSNNTYIGYYSGGYNLTGSGNVCIGNFSGFNSTVSNILSIDNNTVTSPLIGGQFDNNRVGINNLLNDITRALDINGELRIRDLVTTNPTLILGADSDGVASSATLGTGLSFSGTQLNVADQSPTNELITAVTSMGLLSGGNTIVITEAGISRIGLIPPMTGASAGVAGVQGVVPAPAAGQQNHFLRGDGTWQTVSGGLTGGGTATQIAYWDGSTSLSGNNNLYWNNGSVRMGIGTSGPTQTLHVNSPSGSYTSAKGLLVAHGSASQQLFIGHTGATQTQITMNEANMFGNNGIYINSNGAQIGIKTPSASRDLDINGNARIRGAIYDTGDSPGTSGQVLKSAGSAAFTWGDIGTVNTYTTPGTTTWNKPAGAKMVYIKVIAAGGGGAGGDRQPSGTFSRGGGGGGGGGISEYTFRADDLPSSLSVGVGGGGTGGAGATTNGTNGLAGTSGGVSSVWSGSDVYIRAYGGVAGSRANTTTQGAGGIGVIEDGGTGARYNNSGSPQYPTDTKVAAGAGGLGDYIDVANNLDATFRNGSVRLLQTTASSSGKILSGDGGNGGVASLTANGTNGTAGSVYGSGGGGGGAARNGWNGGSGGSGADGAVVIITYY